MNFLKLNPTVHSAALYERPGRSDVCCAYDARIIYLISGEITYTVGGEKKARLSPGNLLYIPSGMSYSLKSKYMRAVVISFDLAYKHIERCRAENRSDCKKLNDRYSVINAVPRIWHKSK